MVDGEVGLVKLFGDGHRRGPDGVAAAGAGDLYRELTSLVAKRRVVIALFFSAGSKGSLLGVSPVLCFRNACSDSHTSIHSIPIRPH